MRHSGFPVLKNMYKYSAASQAEDCRFHQSTYRLLFIAAQSVTLTINENSHTLCGFGCISLPPNTTLLLHRKVNGGLQPIAEQLQMYVCDYEWTGEESSHDSPLTPVLAEQNPPILLEQASALFDLYENRLYNSLSQRLPVQARFLTLFADAWWALEQPASLSFTKPLDGIDRVISYLHTHYDRKIQREDAVAMSGLSLRQFTLSFKQRTGSTFTGYLNRIRVDKVKAILLQSRKSLNEVARQVGYTDEFYLSRKFKQVTGMSPTVYLRKPSKIASLDHACTLDLLSLGVTPCTAITDIWVNRRFRLSQASNSFQPIYWQTTPAERLQILRRVKPDIILYPLLEDDEYSQLEQFRQLGLVIQIPWRGVSWKQHFMHVAQITGMEQQARSWLGYFDHKAGQAREILHRTLNPQATIAMINVRSDRLLIYANGYMGADLLYDILQLTPPQAVKAMRVQGLEHPEFSIPQLSAYDADHYFVSIENNPAARQRAAAMMNSPEWLARTAVKRKCVYPVDMTKWYGYGPAALDAQLDEIMHDLLPNCPKKHESI
ncbi:helix-turn-helix domain-containing protein [Paenibacillus sp. S150]|uniref:helix-turn-helix domain-containing protein n=1 Tax=Paenibacillus sp. S150 TaxID=2749826 RepID=UPI001C5A56B5|nr:helix-turn-helix domain-containing protein [Paenibacillus sp. S150]MBW4079854.1 helix-turn-helix domain-containing protein [Paenibacillus sp. S150]